ncbi:MAG: hypothetical protein KatS3mg126_1993 [Lysobacteraceae bacterium]|nr:MAG: hypothetical protein KatS3mg126_1993 [Xanthomonadaceae bacterium]
MSGHDPIDDYLSELMDDPAKGRPAGGDRRSDEVPAPSAVQGSGGTVAPAGDATAAPSTSADDPLAAFREGGEEISEEEFEAMLDALQGRKPSVPEAGPSPSAPAAPAVEPAPAPAASAEVDPLAAFREGGEEISEEEFEAMLDALQGRKPSAPEAGPSPSAPAELAAEPAPAPAASAEADPLAAFREGGEEISEEEFEAMLDALQGRKPQTPSADPPKAAAPSRGGESARSIPGARLPERVLRTLLPPDDLAGAQDDSPAARKRRAEDRTSSWLRFHLARQCFAVEVLKIQEVLRVPDIVPVRGADPATLGVMNLRGQIVPVLDLAVRLGFPPTQTTEGSRVIVLEEGGDPLGVLVASVADVVSVTEKKIEQISGTSALNQGELVRGISRREGEIIILLDASALLR